MDKRMGEEEERTVLLDMARVVDKADVPFLSGKERGEHARKLFKLDELDEREVYFIVRIPESIKSISSSYSLGLFSESFERLGSLDAFVRKFQFEGEGSIIEKILSALARGRAGPPVLN